MSHCKGQVAAGQGLVPLVTVSCSRHTFTRQLPSTARNTLGPGFVQGWHTWWQHTCSHTAERFLFTPEGKTPSDLAQ